MLETSIKVGMQHAKVAGMLFCEHVTMNKEEWSFTS
jgi:hypothetical protein